MHKRSVSRSAFFNLRALIGLLLCAATAYFILIPIRSGLAFLPAPSNASQRTLTLEERVSYQRAIEDVYWRHRIWPKDRNDPKPSLDAVMSQAQLEKKVTDYLRKSQALAGYWQRPITADQLQTEMDRMAKHTRQPEVLQELFEALGNDPFVIAECLARSALAERLITNWYSYDQRIHGELKQRAEAELRSSPAVGQMKQLSGKYSEIEFIKADSSKEDANRSRDPSLTLDDHQWDETVDRLAASFNRAKSQLRNARDPATAGGRPLDLADVYQTLPVGKLSSLQEDAERYYATAILNKSNDRMELATVSWLKESFESWRAIAGYQAPTVVGASGISYKLPKLSEGGCTEDTWTATAGPPDGRDNLTAVWTGTEMIIWGGEIYPLVSFNSGGKYNPSTDTWTITSTTNAPTRRTLHSAVWTGNAMIVWGAEMRTSIG